MVGDTSRHLKGLLSAELIMKRNKSYRSQMNDGRLKTLYIKIDREMQRDKENESTRDKQRDKIKAGGG